MDPITQGALGATLPQSTYLKNVSKGQLITIGWLGALTGMSPDLDVFIRSSSDPLMFLEYHRQFTHSLFFIPIGALICSLVFYRWAKHQFNFKQIYLICFLAYATHALLDACTTYGTQLFWPLTDMRVSWNNVSVVDPLVTIPLLIMVGLSMYKATPIFARFGFAWVIAYLLFGVAQKNRVETAGLMLAEQRGHTPVKLSAKPSFGNLLLWKSIYEVDGYYYVDAVQAGLNMHSYEGERIKKLDATSAFPWLDPTSQQAHDLRRFDWFSQGYLAQDSQNAYRIIDMRFSIMPNQIKGLWAIELNPTAGNDEHVLYTADRDTSTIQLSEYWRMLMGN